MRRPKIGLIARAGVDIMKTVSQEVLAGLAETGDAEGTQARQAGFRQTDADHARGIARVDHR